ncbi:hypothetical protein [Aureispira sp. CCB-E]|uniref:hypothetical protein n=1 Tax=Aureispira sp. CCB-E TaxID=3051121 RepID=UPI002868CFF1|nr:hypothetical protein [Aureispira sp. CCB-E]WMX15285.1 hypothetical protein QP953_02730 [Aureispira sp. CCB-E]
MALAQTGVVGDIQTGDIGIDLLSGGIGNQGLSGKDLAAIFGAQANAEIIQDARDRQERKQRQKLIVISGSVVVSLVLIVALYFYTSKP